jgi:hypothetical protein
MAQAGYTPIQLYFSTTAAAVPVNTNLLNGELAINITDGKLYYKDNGGTVTLLASSATAINSFSAGTTGFTPNTATTGAVTLAGTLNVANGGTGLTSLTAGYIPFGNGTSSFGNSANLFWDSTNIRLGIGTGSPTAKLNISGSSNTLLLNGSSTSANYARFTSTGGDGVLGLESSTAGTICTGSSAYATLLYTVGATSLQLGTNSNVRATLDSSGNLGIGAAANTKLQVWGTTNSGYATSNAIANAAQAISNSNGLYNGSSLRLTANFGGAVNFTGRASELVFGADNANFGGGGGFPQGNLGAITAISENGNAVALASSMLFYTSTGNNIYERFRINSSGAFGIGGANYGTAGQVLTSGGSGAAPTWAAGGGGSQWTTSGSQIYYNTGNVGIGTASPDTYTDGGKNLTILSSGANSRAQLAIVGTQVTTNEILGRITFTNTNSTNTNYRVALIDGKRGSDNNSGYLTFSTGYTTSPSERMRIEEDGKISFTGDAVGADQTYQAIGSNNTGTPQRLFYMARGYNIHPGKVNNYYGLYSLLNGSDQDGSLTTAAVYAEVNAQGATAVIGKAGCVTSPSYCMWALAGGNTDGYATSYGYSVKFVRSGTGANGGFVGYYCEEPNYASAASATIGFSWNTLYTGTNTKTIAQFVRNGTGVGSITCSTTATAYNTSSDYRLKEDVAPLTGALERVARMKPVTYKWKKDNTDGEGFIAHELADVLPLAVTGTKDETRYEEYVITPEVVNMVTVPAELDADGKEITPERQEKVVITPAVMGNRTLPVYQGVDTSFLVATLTAAIQEQQALIVALTARVEALEAK